MNPPKIAAGAAAKKRTASSKPSKAAKKLKVGAVKQDPIGPQPDPVVSSAIGEQFLTLLGDPQYKEDGISNANLKEIFGDEGYLELCPVINELSARSQISMSKSISGELFYHLVSPELAKLLAGLDQHAKMVYQVIEKAGNVGIWTKDIKFQTNIQQQALTKVLKVLESRHLIKQVKSVTAKQKKIYMLYNLTPSEELTGGVFYSADLEWEHEFVQTMRDVLLAHVKKLNDGKGTTLPELLAAIKKLNVAKVELELNHVSQLLYTLVYDYEVEQVGENRAGDPVFVAMRAVKAPCDFTWWDVLDSDFQYRKIQFEDGVELSAHEPHHQTS